MKENSAPVEADRISDLPDEILCRILSFLPTEQAFKTTFLSNRWASLCYSLTSLSFDDETVQDEDDDDAFDGFCRFVDTLMLSPRATNQPIKSFSLRCLLRSECFPIHILDAWVEAAKRRHVEEFHLTMFDHTFTPTIFASQTLVVLKLEDLIVTTYDFSVHLPSLKTLYLKFVYFKNQKNVTIKILSACPILEDLHLSHHIYTRLEENIEEFKSLFLSKLVRADIGSIDIPFTTLANVEFLNIIGVHEPSFQINIEDIFKGILVFRNLIHIKLLFYGVFRGWVHVVELLHHCPKLQILYMIKWDTSSSMYWESPISDLQCVSSHLRSCTILNFQGSENDIQFAKYILRNANLLQDMKIGVTTSSSNGMQKHQIIEELSSYPKISPGCKLSF